MGKVSDCTALKYLHACLPGQQVDAHKAIAYQFDLGHTADADNKIMAKPCQGSQEPPELHIATLPAGQLSPEGEHCPERTWQVRYGNYTPSRDLRHAPSQRVHQTESYHLNGKEKPGILSRYDGNPRKPTRESWQPL